MGHEPMMVLDENFNFEYVKSTLPPSGLMAVKDRVFFQNNYNGYYWQNNFNLY